MAAGMAASRASSAPKDITDFGLLPSGARDSMPLLQASLDLRAGAVQGLQPGLRSNLPPKPSTRVLRLSGGLQPIEAAAARKPHGRVVVGAPQTGAAQA